MVEVFTITPAPGRSLWALAAVAVLLAGLLMLFGYFALASRATRYEVSAKGLSIRGTMYGRTLPWTSLQAGEARAISLADAPEYSPTLRTNGLGLPGYQAGWFRLRRAGKGLLFLTDRSQVVVIPTRLGYTILLSTPEPERMVAALHRASAGS